MTNVVPPFSFCHRATICLSTKRKKDKYWKEEKENKNH